MLSSWIINTLKLVSVTKLDLVSILRISSEVLNFPKDESAEFIIRRVTQWFILQNKLEEEIANNQGINSQTALSHVTKLTKVRLCNFENPTVQVFA